MNVLVNRTFFFNLYKIKTLLASFHREANFMPDTEVEEGGGGGVEDLFDLILLEELSVAFVSHCLNLIWLKSRY